MGTSINIQVTGFVGSDPQVKAVGEQQVASFSVAVNRKNGGGKKQTLRLRVNCWNKLADVAAQYVKKGSLVQVTTEWLRPSAWVDQSGAPQASLDLDANRLALLDLLESDEADNGVDIPSLYTVRQERRKSAAFIVYRCFVDSIVRYSNDDIPFLCPCFDIQVSLSSLFQRIVSINDRFYLSSLN